jgi:3-hydroxyisobutyrate dehydrogenase-like beta-hydroxyacid dehydrogenase
MSPPSLDLGFVGLGAMGAPMASRLLECRHELAVYDLREEAVGALAGRGAVACHSVAEVADRARTVLVSLPTPEAVQAVVDDLVKGRSISTYVDLSTVGPAASSIVCQRLARASIRYLDAPVSGGPARAGVGRLTIMAAGPTDLFQELLPLLQLLGSTILHLGQAPGQGQLAKLINNLLSASAIAITAEAVTLGVKGGLDAERLLAAINAGSGRSSASSEKFPGCILTRSFDYGFRLGLMSKDVDLCLAEASRQKVPMLLGATVQELWSLAEGSLTGDADLTEMVRLQEQWAGVTMTGRGNEGAKPS